MIFNVDTSNNTLKALSNKAFAKGVLTQLTGENNFSSVKNLVSSWKLENNLTKVENDKVIVNAFINPNDIIILYYNNILSVVPYGKSTKTLIPLNKILSANGENASSYSKSPDAYKAFDAEPNTYFEMAATDNLEYKFEQKQIINRYYLKTDGNLENGWNIEGSVDGTNWATISSETKYSVAGTIPGGTFIIQTPGNFLAYRLSVIDTKRLKIGSFDLLDNTQLCAIDTTDITKGNKADKCFISTEQIQINDMECIKKEAHVLNATIENNNLNIKISHADLSVASNKYTFKILFFHKNNEFIGLDSDIYKNTDKPI